uniref:Uncharacterized protein n=1 Tax=Anguilla anguilla TaxID=7936 RepID=A0A0E9SUB0_ANGAN
MLVLLYNFSWRNLLGLACVQLMFTYIPNPCQSNLS